MDSLSLLASALSFPLAHGGEYQQGAKDAVCHGPGERLNRADPIAHVVADVPAALVGKENLKVGRPGVRWAAPRHPGRLRLDPAASASGGSPPSVGLVTPM